MAGSAAGRLRELAAERAFTRIGRSLAESGSIPAEKVAETAAVVAAQARRARELGAERIEVVATAAIREARNAAELAAAVETGCGLRLRILSGDEEAHLAFAGATRTLDPAPAGAVAVVDVGGGSTEVAVGTTGEGVRWCRSFGVGSGLLADAHLHSDPPSAADLEALRHAADDAFGDELGARPARHAVAVGGSATSLRRLVGPSLEATTLDAALAVLAAAPAAEVALRFGLDPERVRLLPAGIVLLHALSQRLGLPLTIVSGGLREGVVLELLGSGPRIP